MQLKSILTAVAIALFTVASAHGQDPDPGHYRDVATGVWSSPSTWQVEATPGSWRSANGVPGTGDTADLRYAHGIASGSVSIFQLNIIYDASYQGFLTIQGGGTLTLGSGGVAAATHTIDGDGLAPSIVLESSTSVLRFAEVNHTLTGSGYIQSEQNAARIQITNGETLINEILILGRIEIEPVSGSATFENDGWVLSNDGGIILFDDNIALASGGSGAFEVNGNVGGCASTMQFLEAATGLTGASFVLNGGTFDFDVSITAGSFTFNEGKIDIFTGTTFTYNSYSGSCTNPDATGPPFAIAGSTTVTCGSCP